MLPDNDAIQPDDENQNESQDAEQTGTEEKRKIVPPGENEATNSGGSMSEGNLSNSRYGRERTTAVHEKTGIMGSDTDGQAS